jgi:hypothetical protein
MASLRSPNLPVPTRSLAPRGLPFARGNPGRKPGSRNRTTLVAAALLDGEAEALVRKAIELANAGDRDMLKFLLGRILPRERLIQLDLLSMNFADGPVAAHNAVIGKVAEGKITPSEGAHLAALIDTYIRAVDMVEVVKRLDALESKISGRGTI